MSKLLRRLLYWLRHREAEGELREELEFHRARLQETLEQSGLPPAEAAAASRRTLGNMMLAREDARAVWVWFQAESDLASIAEQLEREYPAENAGRRFRIEPLSNYAHGLWSGSVMPAVAGMSMSAVGAVLAVVGINLASEFVAT